jgi:hypothetical protein
MIHVSKVEKQPTPKMTNTFQTNIEDSTYNGWANYETWNVALWMQNDIGYYELAHEAGDYQTLVDCLEAVSFNDKSTPDGVAFNDPKVNHFEINEMMASL